MTIFCSYSYNVVESIISQQPAQPLWLSVVYRTWEREAAGSIPGPTNILSQNSW